MSDKETTKKMAASAPRSSLPSKFPTSQNAMISLSARTANSDACKIRKFETNMMRVELIENPQKDITSKVCGTFEGILCQSQVLELRGLFAKKDAKHDANQGTVEFPSMVAKVTLFHRMGEEPQYFQVGSWHSTPSTSYTLEEQKRDDKLILKKNGKMIFQFEDLHLLDSIRSELTTTDSSSEQSVRMKLKRSFDGMHMETLGKTLDFLARLMYQAQHPHWFLAQLENYDTPTQELIENLAPRRGLLDYPDDVENALVTSFQIGGFGVKVFVNPDKKMLASVTGEKDVKYVTCQALVSHYYNLHIAGKLPKSPKVPPMILELRFLDGSYERYQVGGWKLSSDLYKWVVHTRPHLNQKTVTLTKEGRPVLLIDDVGAPELNMTGKLTEFQKTHFFCNVKFFNTLLANAKPNSSVQSMVDLLEKQVDTAKDERNSARKERHELLRSSAKERRVILGSATKERRDMMLLSSQERRAESAGAHHERESVRKHLESLMNSAKDERREESESARKERREESESARKERDDQHKRTFETLNSMVHGVLDIKLGDDAKPTAIEHDKEPRGHKKQRKR